MIEKVNNLQDRKLLGLIKQENFCFWKFFSPFLAEVEDPNAVKQLDKQELTPKIPNFAQYLIIGGGTAAMSAFKSIRAHDPTAKVYFSFYCLIYYS